jgi:hypothetical protein
MPCGKKAIFLGGFLAKKKAQELLWAFKRL